MPILDIGNGHWIFNQPIGNDTFGFIYLITNTVNGRMYVGCKQVQMVKKSNWKKYTGSSKTLNADIDKYGKDKFTFKILRLCSSKKELRYQELIEIINRNAIFDNMYYNEYISLKLRNRK